MFQGKNNLAVTQTEEFLLLPLDSSSTSEDECKADACSKKDKQTTPIHSFDYGTMGTADEKMGKHSVKQQAAALSH